MESILVFIDGTICDTRHRNHLFGSPEFYSDENVLKDIPTAGSVQFMNELALTYNLIYIGAWPFLLSEITKIWMVKNNFPKSEVCLGKNQLERMEVVIKLKKTYKFIAGIGDRWDDNELHLELGCKSFILKEWEPNWDIVRKYI